SPPVVAAGKVTNAVVRRELLRYRIPHEGLPEIGLRQVLPRGRLRHWRGHRRRYRRRSRATPARLSRNPLGLSRRLGLARLLLARLGSLTRLGLASLRLASLRLASRRRLRWALARLPALRRL